MQKDLIKEAKAPPSQEIGRPNPLAWGPDEQGPTGVFLETGTDDLQLIGASSTPLPQTAPRLPADFQPTQNLLDLFDEIQRALSKAAASPEDAPIQSQRFDLLKFEDSERTAAEQILLAGEVNAVIGGDTLWQIQEAAMPGVWKIRAEDPQGNTLRHFVEVGDVPSILREQTEAMAGTMAELPNPLPYGVMNAQAVLSEISARSSEWQPGHPNHVISFTLFPITEADQDLIRAMLGQLPLTIYSGGFGTCRILATAIRHVWAVQFLNAMGNTVLDTVEIGDIPDAAIAARSDFEDSSVRLREIMEAYLS